LDIQQIAEKGPVREVFVSTYIITCKACGADNRVPAEMEGKRGRCGSCRAALSPLYCRPQALTDSSFDGFVDNYPGPVLVEFWASW
jgi:thioredoxin 2